MNLRMLETMLYPEPIKERITLRKNIKEEEIKEYKNFKIGDRVRLKTLENTGEIVCFNEENIGVLWDKPVHGGHNFFGTHPWISKEISNINDRGWFVVINRLEKEE